MLPAILVLLSPLLGIAQIRHIPKLIIEAKDSYGFSNKDSTGSVVIDTLIMGNGSDIHLYSKKSFKIIVKQAVIGKDCEIYGNDGKNSGTDLELYMGFKQLGSLQLNVSGLDAKIGNRKYPNGDGGKVIFHYLRSDIIPQFKDKKQSHFVQIINKGGGFLTNPQPDLENIKSRINNGTGGRPLGQLPNGKIYSGNTGIDGKTEIKEIDVLPLN